MFKPNISKPSGWQRLDAPALAIAAAAGATSATVGYRTLLSGYPYEDAYILFRYARHLADGRGIVFNLGGPRAEGATDFLWMTTLAGLNRLGVDVAVAAAMLNAAGAALLAYLLCRTLAGSRAGVVATALAYLLVIPVVTLSQAALAAYGGFSSMLYSALVVLLLHVVARGGARARLSIPFLALTLALFRPDGLVLGATFAAVAIFAAKKAGATRSYLLASAISALLGIVYFLWRWTYFGLLLPLPLYVKAHPSLSEKAAHFPGWLRQIFTAFPGLGPNVEWLLGSGVLWMCGLALGGAAFTLRLDRAAWRQHTRRLFPFSLPFILLLAALSRAHQAQNIHWRFEAPVYMAVLYATFSGLAAWWRYSATALPELPSLAKRLPLQLLGAGLVIAATFPQAVSGLQAISSSFEHGLESNYLVSFAPQLGRTVGPSERLAITEAGQIPYWTDANVFDVVGLNSAEAARTPVTFAQLASFDPELIMFHSAGTMDVTSPATADPMFVLTPLQLESSVRPAFVKLFHDGASSFKGLSLSPQRVAPLILAGFLASHGNDYEILAVDLNGNQEFEHIYGLKKTWSKRESIKTLLVESLRRRSHGSYVLAARQEADEKP